MKNTIFTITTLYRYRAEYETEDSFSGFRLLTYPVVKQTDKSYFIIGDDYSGKLKRVPKSAFNAWAHSTKKAAFEHLRRRLDTRIKWYHYWLENCENTLKVMDKVGIRDYADITCLGI